MNEPAVLFYDLIPFEYAEHRTILIHISLYSVVAYDNSIQYLFVHIPSHIGHSFLRKSTLQYLLKQSGEGR